jgi:UDP-N-acetylmuramate dehydrogenase
VIDKEQTGKELIRIAGPDQVTVDERMSDHTTFRIGGPADFFVTPRDAESLCGVLRFVREEEIPYFILGNGSNLLVSDEGYRGVVIRIGSGFCDQKTEEREICAGAGLLLSQIAAAARNAGLSGMEFASGIPGTLGGAIVMNAGAYGGEMKDIVRNVTVMTDGGEVLQIKGSDMDFGYRTSVVKKNNWIVLAAEMILEKGDPSAIDARMNELKEARVAKQPLNYPSAGSTFKRPEGYFAGKLIMDCGLAGCRVGGAVVSPKHCGFVVNEGGATASDVYTLIRKVRRVVYEKYKVWLEPEVKFVGNFPDLNE